MNLLDALSSPWDRKQLIGKQAEYRVRWSADLRAGTILKVADRIIWIGGSCYSHADLTEMREVS